ncbi:MAG: hypothetical protein WA947_14905 [Phormidesmis sp.]
MASCLFSAGYYAGDVRRCLSKVLSNLSAKIKTGKKKSLGWQAASKAKATKQTDQEEESHPGQIKLWDDWPPTMDEVHEVAKKFVLANCFNSDFAAANFFASPLDAS